MTRPDATTSDTSAAVDASDVPAQVAGDRPRTVDPELTTWRYLMTREQHPSGDIEFTIREVYEGPHGALSWTKDPVAAAGDDYAECVAAMHLMSRVVDAPVLDLTLDPPRLVPASDFRAPTGNSADDSTVVPGEPVSRVHNHPPYRPACNERQVGEHLRGACLNDDGTDRATSRDTVRDTTTHPEAHDG